MMEVKQNTAVDLNDLLSSSKDIGSNEVDDALITDLSDRRHDLVNCEIIKTDDKGTNVDDIGNGNVDMTSLIGDVEVDADISVPVDPELEDALLAGEDVLGNLDNKQLVPTSTAAENDILADKVETSNSTTSSNNVRDPGDDLDTLLSKINDIVDDCIDNETDINILNTEKLLECTNKNVKSPEVENNESMIFVAKSNIDNNIVDNKEKADEPNAAICNVVIKDVSVTTPATEIVANNVEKVNQVEELEESIEKTDTECVKVSSISLNNIGVESAMNEKNREKTDYSKQKSDQHSEIISNSNENLEDLKIPIPSDVDKSSTLKSITDSTENKHILTTNDKDLVNIKESKTTLEQEACLIEDTKGTKHVEHEDSDDEIVFYVVNPAEATQSTSNTEENAIDTDKVNEQLAKEEKCVLEKESSKKKASEYDDVVLLLDDDDEEANKFIKEEQKSEQDSCNSQEVSKKTEENKTVTESVKDEKAKNIEMDNSDNACDDFVCEKSSEEGKDTANTELAETLEEANSNCSSSSNLLQEAKSVENAGDEPTPEEVENEEEYDEGDIELIESELKETDSSTRADDLESSPPAKRLRLNEASVQPSKVEEEPGDESKESILTAKETEPKENTEAEKTSDTLTSTLKRTHDVIEVEADEKSNDSKNSSDGIHKKPRTVELEPEVKISENIEQDRPSEQLKTEVNIKSDIKAVPSYQPIPLYPAPKFETLKSEVSLSLDFLKKFRKSFDNMTKQDLEDLVLQKVVEAIIHRSEFSEMRELIEKQEKLITAHRAKISELSKQFRDLEMVHNRVVKDIEQRNSQFIMPVKITRAVGLQVYIPNKKSMVDPASSSTPNISSSPQRPVSTQVSSATNSSLNPQQRQFLTSQTETQHQRAGTSLTNAPGNAGGVRRGCVQKITPTRPVPGTSQTLPTGPTVNSTAYRNISNQSTSSQPRILNKNMTPSNPGAVQRSRYLGSNQEGQRLPTQQQVSRSPSLVASGQRVGPSTVAQPKASSNPAGVVQRRSESISSSPAASSTSSIVDNYINTLTHLTGGNTAVSITPAKPKEKAVIDLTDEDEAPTQTSSAQPVTQIPVVHVPRRNLPGQNNSNSQLQYGRAAPPLPRISPANQLANSKSRQLSAIPGQKNNNSFTSISTPPGTSITRINVTPNAANVQRVKYSHPAPLPATPPQAFNPAWKLPPPRPTIRISNLDNGIVISWTMEESMDRHAECVSYQIYAYQETSGPPMVDSWRHVGDVKAMLLPMAVTLTQFQEGQRYYFAVRAVDCHQRFGPFSLPKTWS